MIERIDGQGRTRTADASLFRAALYHLSYLATFCCPHCPTLASCELRQDFGGFAGNRRQSKCRSACSSPDYNNHAGFPQSERQVSSKYRSDTLGCADECLQFERWW